MLIYLNEVNLKLCSLVNDFLIRSLNHGLWVSTDGDGTVVAVTGVAGSVVLETGGAGVDACGIASPSDHLSSRSSQEVVHDSCSISLISLEVSHGILTNFVVHLLNCSLNCSVSHLESLLHSLLNCWSCLLIS